jgi:hypothetical protein
VVECHPVGNASATIVSDHGEAIEVKREHQLDEVVGHLALAEAFASGATRRAEVMP